MIKKTYLLIAIGLLASLLMASCGTKKEESNEVTETTAFDSTAPFDDIISNIAYINDGAVCFDYFNDALKPKCRDSTGQHAPGSN